MPADLTKFDIILVNTSGGKDSQTMLRLVCRQAEGAGVLDRVVAAHADLGRVEWKGTARLAEEQAAHYGVPFEIEKRPQGDLLEHVRLRGMWPGPATRYCTSDHKRGQIRKIMTRLVAAWRQSTGLNQRCRILNCMGMRAQESSKRAKLIELKLDATASNKTKREVWNWHPILDWTEEQVWADIKQASVACHPAYALGMPRLSCCFCIFAPKAALVVAGHHNPELLEQYVAVEREIDHTFRQDCTLAEVKAAVDAGEKPAAIAGWGDQ
jgi:3'-phosphoadenosine 5'-phosphosulfate sulfotransferase (PAPS reductase)/FAD synthetase